MTSNTIFIIAVLFFSGLSCLNAQVSLKQNSSIEILHDSGLSFFDQDSKVEIIASGFTWTEGPVWVEELQALLFSDIPNNSIFQVDKEGETSLYLKPSGYTKNSPRGGETGSNGLLINPNRELVLMQHGDRRVARMESSLSNPKPDYTTLVGSYLGKKFNSPNDGVFDTKGNLYFTDPPYGLEGNVNDPGKELSFQGVYCLKPNGALILVDSLSRPNGIALSPNEDKLLVANSDTKKAVWYQYDLTGIGEVSNKKLFFDSTHLIGQEGQQGLPDGMKMHSSGYLFASGPGGIWVFDPAGRPVARIYTGEATSNCAFSTDEKTLYLTADSYILKVALK